MPLEKLAASLPEGGRYEDAVVVSGKNNETAAINAAADKSEEKNDDAVLA